jgi:H+/gluconate symporter-like permease
VAFAGAIVTYGGVSLFVAFFVLVPMAQSLFKAAGIPTVGAFGLRPSMASTPLCATALP